MFARRPSAAPSTPQAADGHVLRLARAFAANPFLGAGAAAGLLLASSAVLLLATANPHAGAPSVRVPLDGPGASGAKTPGLRPFQGPDPLAAGFSLDSLPQGRDVPLPAGADPAAPVGSTTAELPAPIGGEAVFRLPEGATVDGAAGSTIAAAPASAAPAAPGAGQKPLRAAGPPLARAPIAGLTAPGPDGPLPVIAHDGRTPFGAYRRPFHDTGKPRIALVVGGLGLNAAATRTALERLPPEVTVSFAPYADGLQGWIDTARAAGHEVLLEIPMEPIDYPSNDPGPNALMANAPPRETTRRLDLLLSRGAGYFGVSNYLGGRFVTSEPALRTFAEQLKTRGLAFVDDGSAARRAGGVPRASADAVVDEQLTPDTIDGQLLKLEARALKGGQALGVGFAYPVTIEQVSRWAKGLAARGYQLAPASAVTRK